MSRVEYFREILKQGSPKKSPRGYPLVYQGDNAGVITVDLHEKWYELWVTQAEGPPLPISFSELEDNWRVSSAFVDHNPNPQAVKALAKARGLRIDVMSFEIMVGRWSLDVLQEEYEHDPQTR